VRDEREMRRGLFEIEVGKGQTVFDVKVLDGVGKYRES